jgi:hypothetical protein
VIQLQIEKGNTVRIEIEFLDFDNNPAEPTNITFKIYDIKYVELSSNDLTSDNKASNSNGDIIPGKYFIDHVFVTIGSFYIEFLGYINGKPTVKREKVNVVFND